MFSSWSFFISTFLCQYVFFRGNYFLTQNIYWWVWLFLFNIPTWFSKTFTNLYSYMNLWNISICTCSLSSGCHLSPPFRTQALIPWAAGILPGLQPVLSGNFSEGSFTSSNTLLPLKTLYPVTNLFFGYKCLGFFSWLRTVLDVYTQ